MNVLYCFLSIHCAHQPHSGFSFFYQSTALGSHAVDGRQMYSSPVIFTGVKKWEILASFLTSLNFEQHAFEYASVPEL